MQGDRPSLSAMTVTLARAHLSWLGIVDDPIAQRFLSKPFAGAHAVLQRRPFTRLARTPTLSFLAARTHFFDNTVIEGLAVGLSQVVIVGAGYDSRSWRLARTGVRFYEVDHPSTQADKRARAPEGGPTFVPADLRSDSVVDLLPSVGYDLSQRTVFVVEGLTMYLDEPTVRTLLEDLASLAPRGSRLAVNFTISGGGSVSLLSRAAAKLIRMLWRTRGEPIINWVRPEQLDRLLQEAGWNVDELTPAPMLAARYLQGSTMPVTGLSPGALVVAATRASSPSVLHE